METRNSRHYREFTRQLLHMDAHDGMYHGVCFLGRNGRIEYAQGSSFQPKANNSTAMNAEPLLPFDPLQFLRAFDQITRRALQEEKRSHALDGDRAGATTAATQDAAALTPAFHVGDEAFHLIAATFTSVCAVSACKASGLVVEKLPFGVLVVQFRWPHTTETVFPLVDRYCAPLRR